MKNIDYLQCLGSSFRFACGIDSKNKRCRMPYSIILDLVELPPRKQVVGCKYLSKVKYKADGSIERYKACLVAKGYAQEYRVEPP